MATPRQADRCSTSRTRRLAGAVNAAASGKSVALTLDASSTWTVSVDSYLTTLSDTAGIASSTVMNIIGNGHTVYYDGSANASLGGLTYSLVNGGMLRPR